MQEDLEVLKRALIAADMDLGVAAVQRLVDHDADPKWILEEGMAVAMFDLGEMWKRGEVFLPEVVASAEVFKACNAIVEPILLAQKDPDAEANALVLLATVKGDLHDLGKNMVGAMLRTSGFDVHDLGKDVSADTIIAAIEEMDPQIIGSVRAAHDDGSLPGDGHQEARGRRSPRAGHRHGGWCSRHARMGGQDRCRRLREQRARGGRDREEAGGGGGVSRRSEATHRAVAARAARSRIGDEHPFAIIGERINPTGRTTLTEELKAGDMTTVQADALAQVAGGRRRSSTSTRASPGSTSRRCSRRS